jgi:hypothetical protein
MGNNRLKGYDETNFEIKRRFAGNIESDDDDEISEISREVNLRDLNDNPPPSSVKRAESPEHSITSSNNETPLFDIFEPVGNIGKTNI